MVLLYCQIRKRLGALHLADNGRAHTAHAAPLFRVEAGTSDVSVTLPYYIFNIISHGIFSSRCSKGTLSLMAT